MSIHEEACDCDCDCVFCTGKWDALSKERKWLLLMEIIYNEFESRGIDIDDAIDLISIMFKSLDNTMNLVKGGM